MITLPFLLILALTLTQSCDTTEPPAPPVKNATISIEDYSLNEIWLKISTDNIEGIKHALLERDNETVSSFTFFNKDTVFIDKNLKPNKTFLYGVKIIDKENDTISAQQINAKTIDTTSHNFNYTIWEFGELSSSILYDVAIIDEKNIWAVGEIHTEETDQFDSNGVWIQPYNTVHWDGQKWELKRTLFYTFCNQTHKFPYQATSIFRFSNNTVAIANNASQITYISNGEQGRIDCIPSSVNKIWGTSSNDIYIVGPNGSIAHYNENVWTKIESGTDLTLTDIYGTSDNEVYVSGTNTSTVEGIILKKDKLGSWGTFIESGIVHENELFTKLYGELDAIWIDERNTIYTGGNLLYRYKNNKWNYVTSLPENTISGNRGAIYRGFILAIRGNGSNDYVIAGDRNTLKHFNGSSWEQIGLPYDPSNPIIWHGLAQKDDVVAAVGTKGLKAIIILLTR